MIKFYHSTMGGGKSAILIAKASLNPNFSIAFKPEIDTRDGDGTTISSRNGSKLKAINIPKCSMEETYNIVKETLDILKTPIKFIYIDEVQFFSKEQIDALLKISLERDIVIECYGLLVDFKSHLFEGSKRLIEVADEIEKITAYGANGEIARQNARIIDGEIQFEGEQLVLGKEETYRAVSNKEYFNYLIGKEDK